ncbi:MAG TPA: phospholipase [Alphaproteobacteria bacterium]|nr:phospholipase [Alphaproteobacteria bacterium]
MSVGPVVPPRAGGPPRQLVLLLHGYGADGADLIGLAGPLGDVLPNALFAAPNAPRRCAQNPFGFEWFPIDFNDMMGSVQAGLPTARPAVLAHLEDAWARTGLGPAATFLIGFSQGAMLALHVGLSLPEPVLGIVSFSGALVPPPGFGTALAARPPVCLVHGDLDDVVDPDLTRQAAVALAAAGCEVSVHLSHGIGHGIAPDGLAYAAAFLGGRVAAANA